MFTSFSADRIRIRRVMAIKMKNPWRNKVILCRREVANTFKECKELNKGKHVVTWKIRTKNAGELWKNCWVLKSFYQERRRLKRLNEVRKTKRSRSGRWRRDTGRGWYRRRKLTLSLWTRALRSGSERNFEKRRRTEGGWSSRNADLRPGGLLRRRRIYKKFRDTWRSGSSRWIFRKCRYTRGSRRRRRRIYNWCRYTRRSRRGRMNWPKDDASGLLLLGSFLWNVWIFFIWI